VKLKKKSNEPLLLLLLLVGWDFWPIVQTQMIDEDDCGPVGGMKISLPAYFNRIWI
jgi:hypothetical protein